MKLKKKIVLFSLLGFMVASCTNESREKESKVVAEGISTIISVHTKSEGVQEESEINNLYLTTHFTAVGNQGSVDVRRNLPISAETMPVEVCSGVRDVLSVVNAPNALVAQLDAATTKNEIQNIELALGEELPEPPFVMSAKKELQTLQQTGVAPMPFELNPVRLAARLDLTIEFDALSGAFGPGEKYEGWSIALQTVTISHLPTRTPLFPKEMEYLSYKETLPFEMNMISDNPESGSWHAANKFYLTENIFSDVQNMDKSTWIEVHCKAIPPAGYNETEIEMTYKVAIGNHQTDKRDFTIRRNGLYTLKLKLVGLDPANRLFIHSEVAPWSDVNVDEEDLMGYPGDVPLINFQLEANVAQWTEDCRDLDKIGLPWGGSGGGSSEGDSNINGDPWAPVYPPGEDLGEGWV